MKRWHKRLSTEIEDTHIDMFLQRLNDLCQEFNISLSHEDQHGSFIIEKYNPRLMQWLEEASISRNYV